MVDTNRKLYRIIRGTYSRRDGNEQVIKDPQTGAILSKRKKAHVIYQAKSDANPHARDEVYMSDVEAFRFGLNRLQPLGKRDVKTLDVTNAEEDGEAGEDSATLEALIIAGENASGSKNIKKWKEQVANSGLLEEVPDTKPDILEALRAQLAANEGGDDSETE